MVGIYYSLEVMMPGSLQKGFGRAPGLERGLGLGFGSVAYPRASLPQEVVHGTPPFALRYRDTVSASETAQLEG